MSQPKWKLLWSTDYSAVFTDETGVYEPEMQIAQEYEDERATKQHRRTKFQVYRFPLDKLKKVGGHLVPDAYEESWPHPVNSYKPWFYDDLSSVARSVGATKAELVEALTSDDASARAMAYESIGGYHGFDNLDGYPQTWSSKKMEDKWPG